jgi:hypothetical protein
MATGLRQRCNHHHRRATTMAMATTLVTILRRAMVAIMTMGHRRVEMGHHRHRPIPDRRPMLLPLHQIVVLRPTAGLHRMTGRAPPVFLAHQGHMAHRRRIIVHDQMLDLRPTMDHHRPMFPRLTVSRHRITDHRPMIVSRWIMDLRRIMGPHRLKDNRQRLRNNARLISRSTTSQSVSSKAMVNQLSKILLRSSSSGSKRPNTELEISPFKKYQLATETVHNLCQWSTRTCPTGWVRQNQMDALRPTGCIQ